MTEAIEGTAVEEPGTEVVRAAPTVALAVTPQAGADELVQRLDVIREAMNTAMQEGVDYGVIPGTDKPALLKPGSEKLGVLFQLDIQLENEKVWGPDDHLTVLSRAVAYHAPSGTRLGFGEGVCTTRERKYAYRRAERKCPSCGAEAVIKGKAEYGGGWLCWKKKDGCGSKFPDSDPAITGQAAGDVANPDLPDLWNTVVKMAEKRARVDVVLAVTGASALFTQDTEDLASDPGPPAESEPAPEVEGIRPEQYQQILELFKTQVGGDVEVFTVELDGIGAPHDNQVAYRVAGLTAAQAKSLIDRLSPAEASA